MTSNLLSQFGWLAVTLLIGSLQIIASVLFLRERHIGPMLMLAGAILSLLAGIGIRVMVVYMAPVSDFNPAISPAISALGFLGSLLFFIGLLLLALHRRGLAARITELETILNSQQGNN